MLSIRRKKASAEDSINKKYFEALGKVGAGLGVIVCLENTPFESFPLASTESIVKLVKDINHPNVGVCFDVGHAVILGERLGDSIRAVGGELLKILHIHDNDGITDSHLPPYQGIADIADFAEGLYDIGFDGVISLECSPVSEEELSADISEDEISAKELELVKIAKLIAG